VAAVHESCADQLYSSAPTCIMPCQVCGERMARAVGEEPAGGAAAMVPRLVLQRPRLGVPPHGLRQPATDSQGVPGTDAHEGEAAGAMYQRVLQTQQRSRG
jgi:hypothetical protein